MLYLGIYRAYPTTALKITLLPKRPIYNIHTSHQCTTHNNPPNLHLSSNENNTPKGGKKKKNAHQATGGHMANGLLGRATGEFPPIVLLTLPYLACHA